MILDAAAYRLGYLTFRKLSAAFFQAILPDGQDGLQAESNAAIHKRLSETLAGMQESLDQYRDGKATDVVKVLKKYPRKKRVLHPQMEGK